MSDDSTIEVLGAPFVKPETKVRKLTEISRAVEGEKPKVRESGLKLDPDAIKAEQDLLNGQQTLHRDEVAEALEQKRSMLKLEITKKALRIPENSRNMGKDFTEATVNYLHQRGQAEGVLGNDDKSRLKVTETVNNVVTQLMQNYSGENNDLTDHERGLVSQELMIKIAVDLVKEGLEDERVPAMLAKTVGVNERRALEERKFTIGTFFSSGEKRGITESRLDDLNTQIISNVDEVVTMGRNPVVDEGIRNIRIWLAGERGADKMDKENTLQENLKSRQAGAWVSGASGNQVR